MKGTKNGSVAHLCPENGYSVFFTPDVRQRREVEDVNSCSGSSGESRVAFKPCSPLLESKGSFSADLNGKRSLTFSLILA